MQAQTRRKQYVEVIATHHIDGSVRPQQIIFAAGPIYDVEDVKGVKKVKTLSTLRLPTVIQCRSKEKKPFSMRTAESGLLRCGHSMGLHHDFHVLLAM